MIRRRRFLGRLPVAAGMTLAGCSGPAAKYYRLAPLAGTPLSTLSATVRLREIGLPGYLGGNGLPQPSGAYEFSAAPNDLWAEPLAGMLQSVLLQDLAQRLPRMTVTGSQGSIGTPADFTVEIEVLRFDPDASGIVTLLAQTALKRSPRGGFLFTRTVRSSAEGGADIPARMATMSALWAGLADTLAQAIAATALP